MRFVQAIPRDVTMLVEWELSEARNLKTILDHATVDLDLSKPSHAEANKYLHDILYPQLQDLIKEMEGVDNGS